MRPCFAPHAGAAAPRAARRNSPTSSTGAQLHSRTECDDSSRASAKGSANHKRSTREAGRPPTARFALALCAQTVQQSPSWARRPWIFDRTGDTLASAVRRRNTRRGAGCAAPLDAPSKRRVGAIAGQRQCPRTATNHCARRSSALLVAVSPIRPGHSARRGDLLRVEFHCASDESILFR
jgi:hypothetical protein